MWKWKVDYNEDDEESQEGQPNKSCSHIPALSCQYSIYKTPPNTGKENLTLLSSWKCFLQFIVLFFPWTNNMLTFAANYRLNVQNISQVLEQSYYAPNHTKRKEKKKTRWEVTISMIFIILFFPRNNNMLTFAKKLQT